MTYIILNADDYTDREIETGLCSDGDYYDFILHGHQKKNQINGDLEVK